MSGEFKTCHGRFDGVCDVCRPPADAVAAMASFLVKHDLTVDHLPALQELAKTAHAAGRASAFAEMKREDNEPVWRELNDIARKVLDLKHEIDVAKEKNR